MPLTKDKNNYQWLKFMEHWGFMATAILVAVAGWLMLTIPTFFENLQGTSWLCLAAASFAFMLFGAGLIAYAKMPAYRAGQFFSFGVKSVPGNVAQRYAWGWRSLLLGVVLSMGLLLF